MSEPHVGPAAAVRAENGRWVSGKRFRVLVCASGMCFMIMLDSNIVAVSLPSIARDLGAAFSDIEWVVSAYVLTFAALLMPSGALADRFGRRHIALIGLSLFTLCPCSAASRRVPSSSTWRVRRKTSAQPCSSAPPWRF